MGEEQNEEADSSNPSLQARPIKALSEQCINKIAAGEIIQRPANALKELLENAIDAGAKKISITAKDGGLKSLSIQDNGSGIRKSDLPILCERFTTSKIANFEDLQGLTTYGFRGEALASISHVARLTVTTKTRDDACGWKAAYADGKLIPLRPGVDQAEPKPAASNDGTLLQVDDLFFNVLSRRKALRSGSDEYARILDVASKYAIHNQGIAISCKKTGSSSTDLATTNASSTLDNIAAVYTESIRRNLLLFETPRNTDYGFSARGYFSSPNYSAKKGTFVFFINNRLVDSTPLKRAFEAFYTTLLAKGCHPFVYFALNLDPDKIDVNVHPTKSEVFFMDEEEIISNVIANLARIMENSSTSRSFTATTKIPLPKSTQEVENTSELHSKATQKAPPQKLVRTDATAQTLDGMFGFAATQRQAEDVADNIIDLTQDEIPERPIERPQIQRRGTIKQSPCGLTSVKELREAVEADAHQGLDLIFHNHTFVGMIGPDKPLAAVQHETKLYLVNHAIVAKELFYQLGLRQFGRIGKLRLEPAVSLRKLVELAVACTKPPPELDLSPADAVNIICETLIERRSMLEEYFSLVITEQGIVESIPLLLGGYEPHLDRLPLFLMRAAVEVDWLSEKGCFESFLRELALLYTPFPIQLPGHAMENTDAQQWQIQYTLYPAFKAYLKPSNALAKDGNIAQIASLDRLYRVFERC